MTQSFKYGVLAALAGCLSLAGCGGSQSQSDTVSGSVSAAAQVSTVSLKDSSTPRATRTAPATPEGAFAFDVGGLTPPFVISALAADGAHLSALAAGPGRTNVDPVTSAAGTASGVDSEADDDHDGDRAARRVNYETVLQKLRTVLAPLFDHYGVTFGEDADESAAFRAMLREVSFSISGGNLVVANRATNAVIYSAPLSAIATGVLHPENIPGGATPPPPPPPPVTDGATLYTQKCAACHGPLATSAVRGKTAAQITAANMTQGLTPAQVQAVATALANPTPPPPPPPPPATCTSFNYSAWAPATCPANGQQTRTVTSALPSGCTGGTPVLVQACTPPPPPPPPPPVTCTSFTYSAWAPATCPANGQQTRTVATRSPSGCTGGTPVLTQACTPPPPPPPALDGAALYTQSCAGCHGPLATSNLKGKRISLSSIKSRNMTQGLTDAQLNAIVTAVGP